MNICITGALGHIGSKLIRQVFCGKDDNIFLVDNFFTQRYASLFDLPEDKRYTLKEIDILSKDIESVIEASDVLVHLAAITNAEASFHNPELVNKVNLQGGCRIADLCAKHNCKLIFLSTTSVYGTQAKKVDENCSADELKPQSPYAESKLQAEEYLRKQGEEKTLSYVILRLGTIFGYSLGMRFHTAVNKFTWQALNGQDITVWKTALNQKRPYCGLNDCIAAINYIIANNIFDGEIYNIVTTNLTVQNILDSIKQVIPAIKTKFVDSPIMNQLSYDVANAKSLAKGFCYKDDINTLIGETVSKLRNINNTVLEK